MPLVSVVIPTFGRATLVCRAVGTALSQTMRDLEVIVVIDGNDPATRAALAAIGDPRLRVISHPTRRGAGAARDTGADAATGTWIALLDDDDEWLPGKLAAQLAAAPDEPAVLMTLSRVISKAGTFVRPGEAYDERIPLDEWLFDRRTWTKGGESFLQCSSLMMPRALFALMRFADMKQHDDWEFVLRAVKQHGYRLVTVPEPLVVYYMPEARASLSRTHTWRRSIIWALSLRAILTRRAMSGFFLTVAAQMAASFGQREGFAPLCAAARRYGTPTPKQLFAFIFFRASPLTLRRRLRAWMQAERR
ncbi:Glycosyltransferase, GT2 family [Novosphingobium sp. CF614]|uniref:glycosyltransferase family 2 protein n=1 Tax=Novosphingobium sp. CF614 TaxID=1884364 RepID=UPI0008E3210C|nr:glycosyltransferase family 2 protein [Novosphingobium sp. CF614]SFG21081.1 Glycosyltransferase, GT2 family [Novosphingobium sp. CF614]